ncbi:MAG TPA: H-X9-DG-CTERM domain-containing protein, partial [Sedimentisphaerales bacterium]
GATLPDSDYGYNELGTGWKDVRLKLGLGFIIESSGPMLGGQSATTQSYVGPASIKAPSDLVAIADGDTWLAPNYPTPLGPLEDRPHAGSLFLPHNASANVVFCDGHVAQEKGERWIETTDSARKRWNNDNQPHPETW